MDIATLTVQSFETTTSDLIHNLHRKGYLKGQTVFGVG